MRFIKNYQHFQSKKTFRGKSKEMSVAPEDIVKQNDKSVQETDYNLQHYNIT